MRTIRFLACSIAFFPVVAYPAGTHHEWDYGVQHGPGHWGDLKQEFASCASGKTQSPIDIRDAVPAKLAPIRFDYRPVPLRIIDNGPVSYTHLTLPTILRV